MGAIAPAVASFVPLAGCDGVLPPSCPQVHAGGVQARTGHPQRPRPGSDVPHGDVLLPVREKECGREKSVKEGWEVGEVGESSQGASPL